MLILLCLICSWDAPRIFLHFLLFYFMLYLLFFEATQAYRWNGTLAHTQDSWQRLLDAHCTSMVISWGHLPYWGTRASLKSTVNATFHSGARRVAMLIHVIGWSRESFLFGHARRSKCSSQPGGCNTQPFGPIFWLQGWTLVLHSFVQLYFIIFFSFPLIFCYLYCSDPDTFFPIWFLLSPCSPLPLFCIMWTLLRLELP